MAAMDGLPRLDASTATNRLCPLRSERPATVRELREMLFGSKPLTQQQLSMTETHRLLLAASPSWQDLFYQNRVLVGVALALAVIAIIISLP